ncbi:hypothetical protein TTHERM_01169470 (macronuclear) [Tetrahymena thermophila SB210]|uniref:Uncharacterized protein n=1 Tax=Tetrahymena thermophila (strain SB210) TaxID=312017 RepID=Q22AQ6_TETTS|nr:hypothetical protein TTHERM_01169470 [Tetrahymena thermophila SB210]EAR82379.2 hypothetical protein TTHERM_01169470 [Tetrahymena thermophila SB210]|eukprot:XP_001030042.2 hypothetical protein TTHERM_01169470 [Tetrahymena thermophila SB210]
MQQLTGNQQTPTSASQYASARSNSMYNITKPEGLCMPTPKQSFIANNISFGRDTQAISYKAKPCILTQQQAIQTDIYKQLATPSSIIGPLSSNSTSKSINNSAQKTVNQFNVAQTAAGQTYQQNVQATSSSGFSINSLNSQQQQQNLSYQYNSSRNNRQPSHVYSSNAQNLIVHPIGDIAHKIGITSLTFEKKPASQQLKENNENCLGVVIQNLKQYAGQLGPTLVSNKMIPQQIPFIQSPLKTSLQSSGKKTDKIVNVQILSQNQNIQNAVLQNQQLNAQDQAALKIAEKEAQKEKNLNLFKESSIKFITNTDLEAELKDLAHLLKRDKDMYGSNIMLTTDREQVIPEMKMEIELLKEQNDALKSKVDELTLLVNDKEMQKILEEKNFQIKQVNADYEQLAEKYASIEKAYDLMHIEYDSLNQKYLELQSSRSPRDTENVDLVQELEKKVLYMEEKMREDEIQSNKMKMVVLKQEESISILENLVREAREAQLNAEKQLTDELTNRSQKETQISERYETQKTELILLNNKIEMLKLDAERICKEKYNLEKLVDNLKVEHEEKLKEVKMEMKKKIKELKKTNQNLEKEISMKENNLLQIENEGVILSKNTNALSDKVLELQSLLEKKIEEVREKDKVLQEEQNKYDLLSQELQTQRQSFEVTINQLQNSNKSIQEQLLRKNILLDSASVSFEVNQKCLIKEKEEALEKIIKCNEEISHLKKTLEEQQFKNEDLQEKINDLRLQNENMLLQAEKLRSENLEQMRIFQDTQKSLNNRIDQLISENNKLQQTELLNLNERCDKFNLMFQQLQQEKLQLIQDNSIIVQDKITLSEKVRELQQNNIDLLSKIHNYDNQKNKEIVELKYELDQLINQKDKLKQENHLLEQEIQEYKNNINSYKEQINSFIVEINQFQLQLDTLKQESRLKTEQIHQQENLILNQKNQIDTLVEKSYLDQESERLIDYKLKELEDEKIACNQKYENAIQNLRINEEQLRSLSIQLNQKSEQVKILEDYKNVLTQEKEQQLVEINKCHLQINKLSAELKEAEQSLQAVQDKCKDLQVSLNSASDQIFNIKQQYSQELIEKDQMILQCKEQLRYQCMNQIEQSQVLEEMTSEIEKQKNLEQQVQNLRKENEKLELEQIKLLKDNEILRLHLIQKQPDNCQIELILEEHNQILTEYHEEIQRLKDKLQQKQQILEKFTNKIQIQSDKIAENEKEISNLQSFIANGKKHYENLIEEYQLKMDQMQQQNTQQQIVLNNQIHLLMQDKQQMKSHLDQIQKEMSDITQLSLKMSQIPQTRQ